MAGSEPKRPSPLVLFIFSIVALLISAPLTWIGCKTVASELSLRANKAVVDARVADTRIEVQRRWTNDEVRHPFQVSGSTEVHDHGDQTEPRTCE